MTLQDKFASQLRKDLEEHKKGLIEEAVEEYRDSLNAILSDVVDKFVNSIACNVLLQTDPVSLNQHLEFHIVIGDEFSASRDTAKGCKDK